MCVWSNVRKSVNFIFDILRKKTHLWLAISTSHKFKCKTKQVKCNPSFCFHGDQLFHYKHFKISRLEMHCSINCWHLYIPLITSGSFTGSLMKALRFSGKLLPPWVKTFHYTCAVHTVTSQYVSCQKKSLFGKKNSCSVLQIECNWLIARLYKIGAFGNLSGEVQTVLTSCQERKMFAKVSQSALHPMSQFGPCACANI